MFWARTGIFFAAAGVDFDNRTASYVKPLRLVMVDVLWVVVLGIALFAVLAGVLKLSRRRRRRITGGEIVIRGATPTGAAGNENEVRRRFKRRQRRRDHRGRNPTLADTGGINEASGDHPSSA